MGDFPKFGHIYRVLRADVESILGQGYIDTLKHVQRCASVLMTYHIFHNKDSLEELNLY